MSKMYPSQLFEKFHIDSDLEDMIMRLMVDLDTKGDFRQKELERVYYEVRDKNYTAEQLVIIANERFNFEVDDEVLPLLTSDDDANLNRDTIIADFASKILLFYLEEKYHDLYGRIQRMKKG